MWRSDPDLEHQVCETNAFSEAQLSEICEKVKLCALCIGRFLTIPEREALELLEILESYIEALRAHLDAQALSHGGDKTALVALGEFPSAPQQDQSGGRRKGSRSVNLA